MKAAAAPDAAVSVLVADQQEAVEIDADCWAELARASLVDEGVDGPAELGLSFVDGARMAELHRDHLGGEGPTDVLAFPIDPQPDSSEPADPASARLLGDVVVCPEVAARQAEAVGHTVDDEIALLVVHGVLHVVGHDHAEPDEAALMRSREQALLAAHHARSR